MRRVSPGATWIFARLGWPPNAVTAGFIVCGLAAGAVLALGGLASAIVAAVLVQAYLLLDCADGELARWSGRTSATGVYLDGIGHYLGETALLAGLGIRAQGHLDPGRRVRDRRPGGGSARGPGQGGDRQRDRGPGQGRPAGAHADAALAPRAAGLARARRLAAALRVHRAIQAVELSLLILVAAVIDAVHGGLTATRVLMVACLVIAGILVPAHLAAIVASRRLR